MTCHPGDNPDGDPIKLDQVGISHLSFSVRDLAGLVQLLKENDVEFAGSAGLLRQHSGRG